MLGTAVLFQMHEQGSSLILAAAYSMQGEDPEQLRDKLISITGQIDEVRYTRETYKIIDLQNLHHRIALNMVDENELRMIRDIAPELYVVAKRGACTDSFFRVTHGWEQLETNRNYFKNIK